MNSAQHTHLAVGRLLWTFIRSLARDNAYELYLDHHRAEHPDERPPSRREFYLREQQRKWGGITRCC